MESGGVVRRLAFASLGLLACYTVSASEPEAAAAQDEPGIEQLLAEIVEKRLQEVEPILRNLDIPRIRIEQLLRLCGQPETAEQLRESWWTNTRRRISAAVDAYEPENGRRDYLLRVLTALNAFELGVSAALAPFVDERACESAQASAADALNLSPQ